MESPIISSTTYSVSDTLFNDGQSLTVESESLYSNSQDASIVIKSANSNTTRTEESPQNPPAEKEIDYNPQESAAIHLPFEQEWFSWQRHKIEQKLLTLQRDKKCRVTKEREVALQLEKMLPMDLLAREWFNDNAIGSNLRVYLIEKLLPTLILGMEKILIEAQRKGLIHDLESHSTFNPINLLAQFLMRNNPHYSHLADNSPYARGLHEVAEELKRNVFDVAENKLARLKLEAHAKRVEMEEKERKRLEDKRERERLFRIQFRQWLLDDNNRLQLQLIQNSLYSYLEISSHLASEAENVIHYSKELEVTDESGITLNLQGYIDYLEEYVCEMEMKEFKGLLRHLDQCAVAFRKTFEHEVWRDMFSKLFNNLDTESCGYVDRHRLLHLLEKFWDKLEEETKEQLHNPRRWPVIELEELDDFEYPDSDEGDNATTEEVDSSEWASVPVSAFNSKESDEKTIEDIKEKEEIEQIVEEKVDDTQVEINEDEKETPDPAEKEEEDEQKEQKEEQKEEEKEDLDSEKISISTSTEVPEEKEEERRSPEVASPPEDQSPDPVAVETGEDPSANLKGEIPGPAAEEEEKSPDVAEEFVGSEDAGIKADLSEEVEKVPDVESVPDVVVHEEEDAGEQGEEVVEKVGGDPGEEEVGKEMEEVGEKEEEKSEEEEEPKEADTREKLLSGGTALNLITPASSVDVGPVSIQFSKEPPQPQVRKTTSYSTVQRKRTEPSSEARTWGSDPIAASFAPVEAVKESDDEAEKDTETIVTTVAATSGTILVQHNEEELLRDDYVPYPVEVKTRPASMSRMSVTFAAEPLVLPDRPSAEFFSHYSSRSHSRMTSVFDEGQLNLGRFLSLLDNFVCDDTGNVVVEDLVNFIYDGYVETEEEKMARLAKARREILSAKHRQMIDNLFNKWDNDGQGHVDNEAVDDVLSKYKGGMEASALKRGRQAVRLDRKGAPYHDRRRLIRREFHLYINSVVGAMSGGEEVFDGLIEYATGTVERSYAERVRGDARRKWLAQIQSAAETGGASMDSVYRAIFQTFYKDADAHGNQKKVSSYIALLEHNTSPHHTGALLLRYVACTQDSAPFMLGKGFYEDMKGISFYAVRRGKLVHVPRVQSHGRIYFWNPDRFDGDHEGSLVLVPLRDSQRRTYGLIGVDNVDNATSTDRSIFASHEINFYQGVAKTFSSAFHHVDLRRKLLRIVDAAMSWVHSRAPRVRTLIIYFVEPDPKAQANHVLRKMMTADNNTGVTITHARPSRLYRKDNLFRDYLFKCMENSETTSADAYGERHTAYPLRDEEGRCQCVIDISIGTLRALPKHERKEVQRMLKLLQAANREVMKESKSGEKNVILEAEERGTDETRVEIMFDRLMLTDLRENVRKLDNSVFAELKNYKKPPPMIHKILKAVLFLFYHEEEKHREFEEWDNCKLMVNNRLRQQILTYDPTADAENGDTEQDTEFVVASVGALLKGIAHGAVAKQGSRPAQQLYNWAFVCLSLIEHAKKMRMNEGQPAITPVTSASTITTVESNTDG